MKQKGEAINREPHPNEIWIIDSRLAFNNIPDAFSVRLTTNADIAGKRLFNDKTRGKMKIVNIVQLKKQQLRERKEELGKEIDI